MNCEFCEKEFSTKSSLTYHKKTAKYCLEKQGKKNEEYKCCYCDKLFTTYQRVIEHQNISCKLKDKSKYEQDIIAIKEEFEKYKKQEKIRSKDKESYCQKQLKESKDLIKEKNDYIAKLEGNIAKLEAKLEKFEDTVTSMVLCKTDKKPTTNTTNNTTNIVINNSLNLNDISTMSAFLEEKMDKEVVAGGQKGLAFLLSNTVLKDKYKCVDPSRQNFEFTNELGEVERDVKAKKLTNALIRSDICAKAGERGIQLWKKEDGSTDSLRHDAHSKKVLEMIMFSQDNSTFRSELSALTS